MGVKKRKNGFTLGKKIVLLTLLMCAILCAVSVFVSYTAYSRHMTEFLQRMGSNLNRVLESRITPEELDHYFESQETDDRYFEIQDLILDLVDNNDVEYLYIVRPNGVGVTFLFDSDMRANENGDYYAGGYCSLGTYVELEGQFAEQLDNFLLGREIAPIIQHDAAFGWLMTVSHPVRHKDGTMAGYIMTDISMNDVVAAEQAYLLRIGLLLLVLTLGVMIAYLVFVRKSIIQPIRKLTDAARAYEGGENKASFANLQLNSRDELSTLAEAFRMMLVEIELHGKEQTELAVREERMESELRLATEINAALLPKALPEPKGGLGFGIQGRVEQSGELSGSFYDYYLLDRGRLAVVIGEVPDRGMSAALFMVVAQTAIKSQMRSGAPLAEAMTAVNRQLFEIGRGMALNALVGVLDEDGVFSYINAGQRAPLLMRDQDRYEWLKSPVYAPLGQNENVVYQIRQVNLFQGDRLFFHTAGLGDIEGEDGKRFAEQKLQATLNLSRSRDLDLAGLLKIRRRGGKGLCQIFGGRKGLHRHGIGVQEEQQKPRPLHRAGGPEGRREGDGVFKAAAVAQRPEPQGDRRNCGAGGRDVQPVLLEHGGRPAHHRGMRHGSGRQGPYASHEGQLRRKGPARRLRGGRGRQRGAVHPVRQQERVLPAGRTAGRAQRGKGPERSILCGK